MSNVAYNKNLKEIVHVEKIDIKTDIIDQMIQLNNEMLH